MCAFPCRPARRPPGAASSLSARGRPRALHTASDPRGRDRVVRSRVAVAARKYSCARWREMRPPSRKTPVWNQVLRQHRRHARAASILSPVGSVPEPSGWRYPRCRAGRRGRSRGTRVRARHRSRGDSCSGDEAVAADLDRRSRRASTTWTGNGSRVTHGVPAALSAR